MYTPYEVAAHNSPTDCWVSFLGSVYDVTKLIQEFPGKITEPIVTAAGKDISHWFDAELKDVRKHICPETGLEKYYTPMGLFPHIPPVEPLGNWDTSIGIPWWKDATYRIGSLSSRVRVVRIKNVLTGQEDQMEVPSEELIVEIRERYLELNWHAKSYTWKALLPSETGEYDFVELDMNKTLEANGIADEAMTFEDCQMETEKYIPVLHVYWNDDLTVE